MIDSNAEPYRDGNQPITDSSNSIIVELSGNEDTTIRPLRPCLARLVEDKRFSEGIFPRPPTESSSPD